MDAQPRKIINNYAADRHEWHSDGGRELSGLIGPKEHHGRHDDDERRGGGLQGQLTIK